MKAWYETSDDIELKDGTFQREYRLVFETTDEYLAKLIEGMFKALMDTERKEE